MTTGIIALGLLLGTGLAMLVCAAVGAPEGYEDDTGFHRGALPRPAAPIEAMVLEAAVLETRKLAPAMLGAAEPCRSDHAHGAR